LYVFVFPVASFFLLKGVMISTSYVFCLLFCVLVTRRAEWSPRILSVYSACVLSIIGQLPLPSKHNSQSRETLGSLRHIPWQARSHKRRNDLSHTSTPTPFFQ
jgi:hypothetical protein